MTRKEVCELIQRRLAGGTPSNDFEPVISEINAWLDYGIAQAAIRNYRDGAEIDVEYIADAFYTTFKNIPISREPESGYWKGVLPSPAIGVPRGYDITSVMPASNGRFGKPFIRVTPQQLDYYNDLPRPIGPFFWTEESFIYVETNMDLSGVKLAVRMASSAGKRGLNDEVLCPADYIPLVIEYTMAKFQPRPKDNSTDGVNQP